MSVPIDVCAQLAAVACVTSRAQREDVLASLAIPTENVGTVIEKARPVQFRRGRGGARRCRNGTVCVERVEEADSW